MITQPPKELSPSVRVLHLEDNENDHLLVRELFAHDGLPCEFVLAKSRVQFEEALHQSHYDIIISDFTLPSYDGSKALAAARKLQSDVPFIFFSGTIGEETAVDSLKNGATDFVIKERPGRLVAAVRRALQEVDAQKSRVEAEKALRRTEERFRLIARATNDVLWERDFVTGKVWVGDNFQSAFGHDPKTVTENAGFWDDLIHPDDRRRVMTSVASLIAGGGRVWWAEFRLRKADGHYAHAFSRAFVTYDESGKAMQLVGATIDVTERKKAEEKIREQAALLDKAGDAIIVCDLENRIVYWNRSAEKIYGWNAAEVAGMKMETLLASKKKETDDIETQLFERGEWIGQVEHRTKDNRPVILASRWTLVRDDDGEPKSKLVFNTDITEIKQLEEQLLRAQRLESLGALVSGIAHDLNNALVPVLMGVGFLKTLSPLPDQAESILEAMNMSALRGADMLKSVLAFARGTESEKKLIHLDQLVREMCRIINDTFSKLIRCEVDIKPDTRAVIGAATQMHQVLMNLCVNARDAMMPRGGVIKLSVKNVTLSKADADRIPEGRPGHYVCLSVGDTGVGIPPEQIAQIFQPFFTTKPVGKGTGLGLSTSHMIVKNHDGFMQVISKPGEGSEFIVYLPAADQQATGNEPQRATVSLPPGNGETVLVVDDESAILAIVKTTLENFDYRVITSDSGADAVAKLSEAGNAVQLIVADAKMLLMDGTPVVDALKKIKPDVKTILLTGLDGAGAEGKTTRFYRSAVIHKPFTVEKLVTAVHQVFARKP